MSIFQKNKPLGVVGREHFAFCSNLVERRVNIADALKQATNHVPNNALKEADSNEKNASEFFGAVVLPENLNANPFVRYLFAYSAFLAAQQNGLGGYLFTLAGRFAAQEMEAWAMQALQQGNYEMVNMACQRLETIGDTLGDYYIKVAAKAFEVQAAKARGGEYVEILVGATRSNGLLYLPLAKQQYKEDQTALSMLAQYEQMLKA